MGGDTAGDGATSGAPGQWGTVQLNNSTQATRLTRTVIRFGQTVSLTAARPILEDVSINSQSGAALSADLNSFPSGTVTAASCSANGLDLAGGTLLQSGTWGLRGIPYIIRSGRIDVGDASNNPTLTIAPGVVVKSWSGSNTDIRLRVLRTLHAVGTAAEPIVFTSWRDDTAGGDANQSEGPVSPGRGDWSDLELNGVNSSASRLEHVVVRHGGRRISASVYLNNGSDAVLKDCSVSLGSGDGIRWDSSGTNPTIENCAVTGSTQYGLRSADTGGGAAVIRGNTIQGSASWGAFVSAPTEVADNAFTGNANGLSVQGSGDVPFSGNTFTSNTSEMVRVQPNVFLAGTGNTGSGNGTGGVVVEGGLMSRSGTWDLTDFPYVLNSGRVDVGDGSNNATLTIAPGVVIKGWSGSNSDTRLRVLRTLIAVGTPAAPIIFASLRDDTVMGNTNAFEGAVPPNRGDWSDLQLDGANSSDSRLEHVVLRHGGRRMGANLYFNSGNTSTIRFVNSSMASSDALRWDGSTTRPVIEDSTFASSSYGLRSADTGGGSATIRRTTLQGNTAWGAFITAPTEVADNVFTGNANGLFVHGSGDVPFSGNSFTSSTGEMVRVQPNVFLAGSGNAAVSGNGMAGVVVEGGLMSRSGRWGLLDFPYILNNGRVDVGDGSNNATLTISPGVVVKSWSGSNSDIRLRVMRTLIAVGASTAPITFASLRDDTIMGDTNASEGAVSPNRGDWSDLQLDGANSSGSRLEHVVLRHGGRRMGANLYLNSGNTATLRFIHSALASSDALRWDGSTTRPVIEDSTFASSSYGLRSADTGGGPATIRRTTLQGNTAWGAFLIVPAEVADNVFTGNTGGLSIQGSGDVPFNGNSFTSNTGEMVRVQPNVFLAGSGNTAGSGNGTAGMIVEGGLMSRSGTWGLTDFPYVLNSGRVDVGDGSNNVTLTIAPGVAVKSWSGSNSDIRLRVLRTLIAVGTPAAPITFASLRDDAVMGNTNASEGAVSPNRGDWSDLQLDGANSSGSRLEHVVLRHGGRRMGANLYLNSGNTSTIRFLNSSLAGSDAMRWDSSSTRPVIEDSTFASSSYGLRSADTGGGPATIRRTTLQGNTAWGAFITAPTEVADNVFTGNANGLFVHGSGDVPFSGNSFTSSTGEMVRVQPNVFLAGSGNAAVSGNGMAGVVVEGGLMNRSGAWGLTDFPYILNNGRVDVGDGSNNATLTISPGVVVKSWSGSNSDIRLRALRTLRALGTAQAPITFTSLRDDTVMGDTNASEGAVSPNRGDWSDLQLDGSNSSGSLLEHVVVRYGGRRVGASVYLNSSSGTMRGGSVSLSSNQGIRFDGAASQGVLSLALITDNPTGIAANSGARPEVLGNNIQGNTSFGLQNNDASVTILAENNYWGSATGPAHASNPGGTGNAVSNGVDFTPFLTSPATAQDPPTPPQSLTAAFDWPDREVDLAWAAPAEGTAATYRVYRNASRVATVTSTSYADKPAADGNFSYHVTAVDFLGGESGVSNTAASVYDVTGPAITIAGVAEGAVYNYDATPEITVTDFSQFTQEITLNGQPIASGTTIEVSGSYTLAVTAEDVHGNASSASVSFAVDRATFGVIRTWVGGASGDWHNGANWSPADVPTPLDEARIDSDSTVMIATTNTGRFGALVLGNASGTTAPLLRVSGMIRSDGSLVIRRRATLRQETGAGAARTLSAATIAVEPGGLITYGAGDPLAGAALSLEAATSLYVHAGATVSAVGLGHPSASGPGAGLSAEHSSGGGNASGAAHGGNGGIGSVPGGAAYGSPSAPWEHGSGGGNLTNGGNLAVPGGRGGGRIRITAGALRVDGLITADGQSGAENGFWGDRAGGGAGGTLLITASDVQGSGRISASGGAASPRGSLQSGGGGGGRIVLSYGSSSFAGTVSARGGSGRQYGGAGTVVETGTLRVDNGFPGALTPIPAGTYSFSGVLVGSHAAVEVTAAASLSAASFLTLGRSTATNRGTLALTGTAAAEEASVLRQVEGTLSAPRLEARTGGQLSHEGGTVSSEEAETISGGALSVNAPLSLARLLVRPGGLVTHAPGDADFDLEVLETLTIEAGGRVSADAAGHASASGPGAGNSADHASGGGSAGGGGYGGAGGSGSVPGGPAYGSIEAPEALGSGGGNLTNGGNLAVRGGRGGGKLKIKAGTLRVDGTLSADGQNGPLDTFWGDRAGGGSGGSIWVVADRLEGAGVISADGGVSSPRGSLSAGGGAGGRMRLAVGGDAFTGTISARGRLGRQYGGAGTVVRGMALSIANGYPGALTPILPGAHSFATVFIGSHAAVETTAEAALSAASLTAHEGSTFTNRGSLSLTASASAEGSAVLRQAAGSMAAPSLFAKTGGVLSHEGGVLTANDAETSGGGALSVNTRLELRNLLVRAGGLVTHIPGDPDFDLDVAEAVTVESGGAITADEAGFGTSQGPGAGVTVAENFGGGSGSGGGYGGQGGAATQPGGFPYGSMAQPIDLGSGGGGLTSGHNVLVVRGGSGGGRIRISAGTLRVDGRISANGQMGPLDTFWGDRGGGGSGGSVLISVDQLQGSGLITANGGHSSPRGSRSGGGGGGGRIALYYGSNSSTQTLQASGGTGFQDGAAGTILDNGSLLGQAGSTGTVAFSQMEEKLSASQDLTETLSSKLLNFAGATSTGTPAGTLSAAEMRLVMIKTGPFANRGFFRGGWTLSIPAGETLSGQWEGMAFIAVSDPRRIVLKGVMKGRIEGVLDGFLLESVPGSGTFNRLAMAGRLVQVGNVIGASSIYVSGAATISESVEHPDTDLNFLQISQAGEVGGYYQTPIDVAFSLVRVTSVGHPYFGEGFFNAAYDSPLGSGSGWAYAAASGGNTRLAGPFEDALEGLMEGVLTSDTPRALLMTLRNLDAGLPQRAEISTSLSFPGVVPIGGVATVIIELRNDGYAVADGVTVVGVGAERSRFVAASGEYKTYHVTHWREGVYTPKPFIRWDFAQVPARSTRKMSYQVRLPPSTPSSVQAGIDVETITTDWANTIFANYNLGGTP